MHFRTIPCVTKDDDTAWFGTPEAAAYIGTTPRTLYRLIHAGSVPAYKMGRVIRIKRSDLDAFLEASGVQPGELGHLYPRPTERVARAGSFARPAPDDLCPRGKASRSANATACSDLRFAATNRCAASGHDDQRREGPAWLWLQQVAVAGRAACLG